MHDFIVDMDQVFENCKLYNGTESHVGQMGVRVKNEYLNFLKIYNLVERFGEKNGENNFEISAGFMNQKNSKEIVTEELSDSELPKDSVIRMNDKNRIESRTDDVGLHGTD